jgi:ribonucleoside-diphosphate reductase alpha chain
MILIKPILLQCFRRKMEKRPKILPEITRKYTLACGEMGVTVTYDKERIFEIFTQFGNPGGCVPALADALSVAISIGLRSGTDPNDFIKALSGIRCPSPSYDEGLEIVSCVEAIVKSIKAMQLWLETANAPEEVEWTT